MLLEPVMACSKPEDDVLKVAGQFKVWITLMLFFFLPSFGFTYLRIVLISSGWRDESVWFCLPPVFDSLQFRLLQVPLVQESIGGPVLLLFCSVSAVLS